MRTARPSVRVAQAAAFALVAISVLAACAQESAAPTPTVAAGGDACANITTVTDGTLTVATSNPAYPPYVISNDPTNGKGFESATAYAVAKEMGYPAANVKWVYAPFDKLFAPGSKDYDFALNQISITPKRAEAVTFSDPYYDAANAALVLKTSQFASATTMAELQDAKIGVQTATTAQTQVEAQIQPTQSVSVFPNSSNAVQALLTGQIDVFVTDLPTTLYLSAIKSETTVVGQLPGSATADSWGMVLQKDNPLVSCVNQSLSAIKDSGELAQITDKWMTQYSDAPVLG